MKYLNNMSIKYIFSPSISLKEIEEKTKLTVVTNDKGEVLIGYEDSGFGIADTKGDELLGLIFYGLSSGVCKLEEIMTILRENFDSGIFCDIDRYEKNYNKK